MKKQSTGASGRTRELKVSDSLIICHKNQRNGECFAVSDGVVINPMNDSLTGFLTKCFGTVNYNCHNLYRIVALGKPCDDGIEGFVLMLQARRYEYASSFSLRTRVAAFQLLENNTKENMSAIKMYLVLLLSLLVR